MYKIPNEYMWQITNEAEDIRDSSGYRDISPVGLELREKKVSEISCPKCGKKTEVYSRITGYYRPVQNWNDGKRKEFEDRKVYDIENSVFTAKEEETCSCKKDSGVKAELDGPVLFTRNGCPNCKTSKMMLDKAGFIYTVINAEEDKETTLKFGIKKAPTLLVPNGNGFDIYDNASEIRKYIESNK